VEGNEKKKKREGFQKGKILPEWGPAKCENGGEDPKRRGF